MLVMSSALILAFVDFLFVASKFLTDFLIATHFQELEPKFEPEPEGYIWEVYVQVYKLISKLCLRRGISFCPVHYASLFSLLIFSLNSVDWLKALLFGTPAAVHLIWVFSCCMMCWWFFKIRQYLGEEGVCLIGTGVRTRRSLSRAMAGRPGRVEFYLWYVIGDGHRKTRR